MKNKVIVFICFLITSLLVTYGIYLKINNLTDANAYLLGGGVPLLGYF